MESSLASQVATSGNIDALLSRDELFVYGSQEILNRVGARNVVLPLPEKLKDVDTQHGVFWQHRPFERFEMGRWVRRAARVSRRVAEDKEYTIPLFDRSSAGVYALFAYRQRAPVEYGKDDLRNLTPLLLCKLYVGVGVAEFYCVAQKSPLRLTFPPGPEGRELRWQRFGPPDKLQRARGLVKLNTDLATLHHVLNQTDNKPRPWIKSEAITGFLF